MVVAMVFDAVSYSLNVINGFPLLGRIPSPRFSNRVSASRTLTVIASSVILMSMFL